MRVSPVGWAFGTLEKTLAEAQRSVEVTHNHPEGIKGAQSVAAAIFLARQGTSQAAIADSLAEALYGGVPADIARDARSRLTPQFADILDAFQNKYLVPRP